MTGKERLAMTIKSVCNDERVCYVVPDCFVATLLAMTRAKALRCSGLLRRYASRNDGGERVRNDITPAARCAAGVLIIFCPKFTR